MPAPRGPSRRADAGHAHRAPRVALALAALLLHAACAPRGPERPPAADAPPTPAPATGAQAVSSDAWTHVAANRARTGATREPGPELEPRLAWSARIGSVEVTEPVVASLAGGRSVALVASGSRLACVDLADGRIAWSRDLPGTVEGSPLVTGDVLRQPLLEGALLELRLGDGEPVRTRELDFTLMAQPLDVARAGVVVLEETSQSASDTESRVHALDAATGEPRWSVPLRGGQGRAASTDGERVFVATTSGVVALDAATGATLWSHEDVPVVRACAPMVADGRVVAARGSYGPGTLVALGASDGRLAWSAALPARLAQAPVLAGDEVLVPLTDGTLARLAAGDGAARGTVALPVRADARMAVGARRVFVAGGRTVVALDRDTWREAWRLDVEGDAAVLAVSRDMLLVARLDGALDALVAPRRGARP